MSDPSPRPEVAESAATQLSVVPAMRPDPDNESLKVQWRFRLSGNGTASRALQSAILEFIKQRES
jgi:hypothetical protein